MEDFSNWLGLLKNNVELLVIKAKEKYVPQMNARFDEDMETILYYGKYYGVMPKSLPRDVFSTANFDNGLSYSIDFKAAFYEDMRPDIIADFNALSKDYYKSLPYRVDVYNNILDRTDNRPAKAAYVEKYKTLNSPNGYVYKLKWKGSDSI